MNKIKLILIALFCSVISVLSPLASANTTSATGHPSGLYYIITPGQLSLPGVPKFKIVFAFEETSFEVNLFFGKMLLRNLGPSRHYTMKGNQINGHLGTVGTYNASDNTVDLTEPANWAGHYKPLPLTSK